MPPLPLDHPALDRLRRVAKDLGSLASEIVFIGGSIAPILQTDPPFASARPTKDVDGVIASTKYRDVESLHEQMRKRGFKQVSGDTAHLHRWRSPSGEAFDLVPAGDHLGGSGQAWDRIALATSDSLDLGNGTVIRHASAAAFLGLKWAAHADRGAEDPYASHDLEDILALVASRPQLVDDVARAPEELRAFIVSTTVSLLGESRIGDILAAHLNNAQDPPRTVARVRDILTQIASLK